MKILVAQLQKVAKYSSDQIQCIVLRFLRTDFGCPLGVRSRLYSYIQDVVTCTSTSIDREWAPENAH